MHMHMHMHTHAHTCTRTCRLSLLQLILHYSTSLHISFKTTLFISLNDLISKRFKILFSALFFPSWAQRYAQRIGKEMKWKARNPGHHRDTTGPRRGEGWILCLIHDGWTMNEVVRARLEQGWPGTPRDTTGHMHTHSHARVDRRYFNRYFTIPLRFT